MPTALSYSCQSIYLIHYNLFLEFKSLEIEFKLLWPDASHYKRNGLEAKPYLCIPLSRIQIRTAWLILSQEGSRTVFLIFLLNSGVGTRVRGDPLVQPWLPAHTHYGLVLMVCSQGLIERWQNRTCIALKKALIVLLSGTGCSLKYIPTLKKLSFSFFVCGLVFF